MIFHTYEWKEKFEHYQVRENMIQKFHYYTENIDGYWVSFPIIVEKERAYFCPVLIEPFNNDLYQNLEDLQIKFLMRINTVPELKDKFIVK